MMTDYAKFDKIDYSALGADDDERQDATNTDDMAAATPEERTKAYLKHSADVEAAKKRLAELEVEQKEAELKLLKLEKERKMFDRMIMFLGIAFAVLISLTFYWVNREPTSARLPHRYRSVDSEF